MILVKVLNPLLNSLSSRVALRAQIRDSIIHREGLILLTGASGTGKTTLCETALEELASTPTFQSRIVEPPLTFEDLVGQILIDFGVSNGTGAGGNGLGQIGAHDRVLLLNRFLESMPSSSRAIVIIDDAHQLPRAVLAQLRSLTNLQSADGKLLQIILLGDTKIDNLLKLPEVRQLQERIGRRCHLEPLTDEEVERYFRQQLAEDSRWQQDGEGEAAVISPEAIRSLATLSKGFPGTLNRLCDRVVDVTLERSARTIDRAAVIQAAKSLEVPVGVAERFQNPTVMGGLALATVATIALIMWMARSPSSAPRSTPVTAVPAQAAPATDSSRSDAVVDRLPALDSFVIAVASFRSAQRANETAQELTNVQLPAFVRADREWHAVLVGPYLTVEEAREARDKIDSARFTDARIQKAVASVKEEPTR
jgi:general secretion pathway protein A